MDTTRPSLLRRIRDRSDADAWRTFDAIYRPMLRRFARARGLSDDDAEDVTQHCLAAVAEHIAEFVYDPQKGRFKSWLRTLVNNRVRDLLRARREPPADAAALRSVAQDSPTPEAEFDRIWLQEHLAHCFRELRDEVEERTFQAFWQVVIDQQPVAEVSQRLSLAPNNIYTIKWRMTERLAAKMRELADELE